jgi:hypothetical protein
MEQWPTAQPALSGEDGHVCLRQMSQRFVLLATGPTLHRASPVVRSIRPVYEIRAVGFCHILLVADESPPHVRGASLACHGDRLCLYDVRHYLHGRRNRLKSLTQRMTVSWVPAVERNSRHAQTNL